MFISCYCVALAKALTDLGQMKLCREAERQAALQEAGSVSYGIHSFFLSLKASDDLDKLRRL